MYTAAIGDVHGCLFELKQLVDHIHNLYGTDTQIITLGDYVDRGPNSRGVIDYVIAKNITALVGNHEDMLIRAYRGQEPEQYCWDHDYGKITTKSFNARRCKDIPEDYINWMERLPVFLQDGMRVYVHAGIQRDLPLKHHVQSRSYNIWVRDEFFSDNRAEGGFVVHGHTPVQYPDLRVNRVNVDTGCCYGGPLTAAVFRDKQAKPISYLTSHGSNGIGQSAV